MPSASTITPRMAIHIGGVSAAAGLMTLLAATPSFAANPYFKIHFVSTAASSSNPGGIPGIQGVATYTFLEGDGNLGKMTLNLDNTSTLDPSYIVGTGFDLPSPSSSPASTTTITVANSTTIQDWGITEDGTLEPENKFGQFDICATTDKQNGPSGCEGGATEFGVAKGTNKNVANFTFASAPPLATATDYRNAFAKLFTSAPDSSFFMRFKGLTGNPDSDKVLATSVEFSPDDPNPPQGPGDAVPGPLPLFGAAAAFGYSRKLRRRMKVQNVIG